LTHEDPRYYTLGHGGPFRRTKYALSQVTTVRLNVEENQLVNVFGEFGICLGDLKSA